MLPEHDMGNLCATRCVGPSTHTWGSCYGPSVSNSLKRGPQVCLNSPSFYSKHSSFNKLTYKVTNTRNPSDYSCDSDIIPTGFQNIEEGWVRKEIQANILQHYLQGIAASEPTTKPTRFQCSKSSDPLPLAWWQPSGARKGGLCWKRSPILSTKHSTFRCHWPCMQELLSAMTWNILELGMLPQHILADKTNIWHLKSCKVMELECSCSNSRTSRQLLVKSSVFSFFRHIQFMYSVLFPGPSQCLEPPATNGTALRVALVVGAMLAIRAT